MVAAICTAGHKMQNMERFLSECKPGLVVEVGVWQGGSIRYLAERFPAFEFIGFDTFEGLPQECEHDNAHRKGDFGDTSYEYALDNIAGISNILLVKGLFPSTAAGILDDRKIVMAHCDVDLYQSTIETLNYLRPRMLPGSRIYCDDAFCGTCQGASIAFCEFCGTHKICPQFDLGSHAAICF